MFTHSRYPEKGKNNYEVSSKGDKRFSALYATLQDGRTIEEAYQLDVKGYRKFGDNWKLGKGKKPLDLSIDTWKEYKNLWKLYLDENPNLVRELQAFNEVNFTDMFANTSISQARALAELLNELNPVKIIPMKEFNPMQYLAIDIANCYGLGKLNFEDRIEWVKTNEKYLEDYQDQAEEPLLYYKAVKALRDAQAGKPIGHTVALYSASSGLQLMSAVMRCKGGASLTGLIDPDTRTDAYTLITEKLNAKYKEYLLNKPELLADIHELQGKTLGCFCKPKDCHGDVLVELVNQLNPNMETKVKLTNTSAYTAKDQAKSDKATQFIGLGSENSSTHQYMLDWGNKANTGNYTADDVVFISINGKRKGRLGFVHITPLVSKAVKAGARFITDNEYDRNRPFNLGEREVAAYLTQQGYTEKDGLWTKEIKEIKPMKTFNPMQYIAIDIANQYGLDKTNYEDRIQWVKTNLDKLEELTQDAEEPYLYYKAVRALRDSMNGIPTNHTVALDSASSGY